MMQLSIGMVDHPRADLMYELHKPTKYLALIIKKSNCQSYLNMVYVEETLKDYIRTHELTNIEYLEALTLVKEYKRGV